MPPLADIPLTPICYVLLLFKKVGFRRSRVPFGGDPGVMWGRNGKKFTVPLFLTWTSASCPCQSRKASAGRTSQNPPSPCWSQSAWRCLGLGPVNKTEYSKMQFIAVQYLVLPGLDVDDGQPGLQGGLEILRRQILLLLLCCIVNTRWLVTTEINGRNPKFPNSSE